MKLVTYLDPHGGRRAEVVAGERIINLAAGAVALGCKPPFDLCALLGLEIDLSKEPGASSTANTTCCLMSTPLVSLH